MSNKQPSWCELVNADSKNPVDACWSLLYTPEAISEKYCEECDFCKHYIGDEERDKRWAERRARGDANK